MTYPAGIAVAAQTGLPLVVHVHSTEFDRSGTSVNQRIYDIERAGMHAATRVICVSHLTRNIVLKHYGVDPRKVAGLRSGLGLGWMFVVAAEFMGASEGLGYLLVDGQQLGKPDQIVAAILCFALLGKATDGLVAAGAAPFLRWQDSFRPRD